ncbi:MAG TPA: hypothetical protein VJG30_00255 [Candidatus Nanoarchaeia archaeon]|nr:hypothetical protein [Candidatus Nanoarchaeia archaeon]
MLDAYIINEIKKREEEVRRKRQEEQPQMPLFPSQEEDEEEPNDEGYDVAIIYLSGNPNLSYSV